MQKGSAQCLGCSRPKDRVNFGSDAHKSDGLRSYCKSCQNAQNRRRHASLEGPKLESTRATREAWTEGNRHRFSGYSSKWQAKNKERYLDWNKRYRKENRALANAWNARRHSAATQATPAWADRQLIVEIYEFAQEFREAGIEVDVDHIVPLCSRVVCGLHVHNNLRPCLSSVNRRKGNKFNPEDESQSYA